MATQDSDQPEPRAYSRQDLNPVQRDPRCKVPGPFPLATFWPVYLGNFWCPEFSQHALKVQEYFASKGLLARVVFCRSEKDDFHFNYDKSNLYDLLVYFVRQQDADDAISYCHREMYFGHRLNVFPGRTPVYFDPSTSVQHQLVQVNKMGVTAQVFERYIHNATSARIDCVLMQTWKDILVQYASVEDRNNAIRSGRLCTLDRMPANQAKQRFLEQDITEELWSRIRTDPSFMEMLPPDNILNALLGGTIPNVPVEWKTANVVKMPTMRQNFTRGGNNETKLQRSAERALMIFGIQCDFLKVRSDEVIQARRERRREKKVRVKEWKKEKQEMKKELKMRRHNEHAGGKRGKGKGGSLPEKKPHINRMEVWY